MTRRMAEETKSAMTNPRSANLPLTRGACRRRPTPEFVTLSPYPSIHSLGWLHPLMCMKKFPLRTGGAAAHFAPRPETRVGEALRLRQFGDLPIGYPAKSLFTFRLVDQVFPRPTHRAIAAV